MGRIRERTQKAQEVPKTGAGAFKNNLISIPDTFSTKRFSAINSLATQIAAAGGVKQKDAAFLRRISVSLFSLVSEAAEANKNLSDAKISIEKVNGNYFLNVAPKMLPDQEGADFRLELALSNGTLESISCWLCDDKTKESQYIPLAMASDKPGMESITAPVRNTISAFLDHIAAYRPQNEETHPVTSHPEAFEPERY